MDTLMKHFEQIINATKNTCTLHQLIKKNFAYVSGISYICKIK